MAMLELKSVRKQFGAVEVIKSVDLAVNDREFVVFVGPSGCGKSTILRMIAGLEEITTGDLFVDGARANDIPPDRRGLAMVFQSYALYPHMTVADNMALALRLAGVHKDVRAAKVLDAAKILQLEPLLQRKPRELSGGQRQRVAIGRAIVREPKAFLFDEPLSNLDAALRVQMRLQIARLHRDLKATTVYVTHDQVEAMTLADRIVVLNGGRIEQVGGPLDLYRRPANLFVAGFIGSPRMNFIAATAADGGSRLAFASGGFIESPVEGLRAGDRLTVGIRPEDLTLGADGALAGRVEVVEHLGDETLVYVAVGGDAPLTVKAPGDSIAKVGDSVRLAAKPGAALLFDNEGKSLMPVP